jgi:hypothetical protein
MNFRSENQRKAVFAQMKAQALQTGARAGHRGYQAVRAKGPGLLKRGKGLLQAGQAKFRKFQEKSPWGSELAIAVPATIIAAAGMTKFNAIGRIANMAGKRGALLRGGAELGAAIGADAAIRRVAGGPGEKRKDATLVPAIGASLLAEGGYRYHKAGVGGRAMTGWSLATRSLRGKQAAGRAGRNVAASAIGRGARVLGKIARKAVFRA